MLKMVTTAVISQNCPVGVHVVNISALDAQ